jgi:predicted porin
MSWPTTYDYLNRSAIATPGLATFIKLTEYSIYYRRVFSPKLEFNGSYGRVKGELDIPGSGSNSGSSEIWSANLRWSPTPKISVVMLASQTVSPAQDIVADLQKTKLASLIVSYFYSPKISFNAAVSDRKSSYGNPGVLQSSQDSQYISLGAVYRITPLTSATASYSYSKQTSGTGFPFVPETTANVFLMGLNYQR